jgi:hypothetical protein
VLFSFLLLFFFFLFVVVVFVSRLSLSVVAPFLFFLPVSHYYFISPSVQYYLIAELSDIAVVDTHHA